MPVPQETAARGSLSRAVSRRVHVPVIALSQLSRAPEARTDKKPMLADLRESGALEQDADVVILLFRPDLYPDCKPEEQGIIELNVAKQRNGPTGRVTLSFLKNHSRFENYAAER